MKAENVLVGKCSIIDVWHVPKYELVISQIKKKILLAHRKVVRILFADYIFIGN